MDTISVFSKKLGKDFFIFQSWQKIVNLMKSLEFFCASISVQVLDCKSNKYSYLITVLLVLLVFYDLCNPVVFNAYRLCIS